MHILATTCTYTYTLTLAPPPPHHPQALDAKGIGCVGPINTKSSKSPNTRTKNSWPHQDYTEGDKRFLPRGWDRVMYQKMASGRWMQSLVWRDNKFVKILSTVHVVDGSKAKTEVQRWIKQERKHRMVNALTLPSP